MASTRPALAFMLYLPQRLFHRIGVKVREIEILFHKDDDARSLIDIDRRRNVDRIPQRFLGELGQRLRNLLRPNLSRVEQILVWLRRDGCREPVTGSV